ncbi:MAG TPA: hypothetical protein VLU94_03050 [Candidatus Nitrosotalea sp.]|nr:hypothetical protein [Candidatus Nitrosotalea sp.]
MQMEDTRQGLVAEVQMFRLRVATAESRVNLLRDQARQAKRRRKEAKRLDRQTRKQFKRLKAELAELREALARAEAEIPPAGVRAPARELAMARRVPNRRAILSKKSKAVARKRRPALPRELRVTRRVTRKKPALFKAKVVAGSPAAVPALNHAPWTLQVTGPTP